MSLRRNMQAYRNADRDAAAESDNPHALIAVLFDELLRHMRMFAAEIEAGSIDKESSSEHFSRSGEMLGVVTEADLFQLYLGLQTRIADLERA